MAAAKERSGPYGLSPVRYVTYVFILICAGVLFYFFAGRHMRFFLVPSSSMEPTLLPYDRIVTLSQPQYHRGDIVVLQDPHLKDAYLVKRVVALGGEEVSVSQGALLVNGLYASEPYVAEPMIYKMDVVRVPEGEVFVLGDNRNYSEDSSTWEPWEQSQALKRIIGKVCFIYFPLDRAGRVLSYPLINAAGE